MKRPKSRIMGMAENMANLTLKAGYRGCFSLPKPKTIVLHAKAVVALKTVCFRKIAKKAAGWEAGCFTLPMLERDCRIAQGVKGIDPDGTDKERSNAEAAWLKAHPAFTEETREKMRARGEIQKAVLSRHRSKKEGSNQG